MASWLDELAGGDRRSVGRAPEVARWVLDEPARLAEIVEGLLGDDAIVRSRCAHVIEAVSKTRPEFVEPFKRRLLRDTTSIEQWEVREQMSKAIPRLTLSPSEVATMRAVCIRYLDDRSSIVRACAMQALVDLLRFDPSHEDDVREVIGTLTEVGTAAMRARGRKLLKQLGRR